MVLGIESSCDGTGAGVVSGGRLPLPAHVVAPLEHGPLPDPRTVLVVSGGHTSLLLVRDLVRVPIPHLGDTVDDAGECLDKVTRVFGPPCPRGPVIARAPRGGSLRALALPRPLPGSEEHPYGFSSPGPKTAAARRAEQHRRNEEELPVSDGAASLRGAVADALTRKVPSARRQYEVRTPVAVGGVAANSRVRVLADKRCAAAGVELRVPPMTLCTDGGAMVAAVGDLPVRSGSAPAQPDLSAGPSAPLGYAALRPAARPAMAAA
ncbi:tRNA (adenosine(37)-N6)-threonylcarbamoyltransferase complex transferase subunit TsaD [Streptomyces sp. SID8352]|uniref:tRNA (adenosine(37)-N6)-threonylcarbamoyltransferase complex transferase subunit TsaD n=1 Tax=Streptomyces sp. SID8352 TaxID=2690338 RepID=UPI00136A9C11|nr:tRNA (adenosine(37)-N6)-threonylcarbamoyltransferase complex transferase subunit TsaD [Streptomyces sp. SID8352]